MTGRETAIQKMRWTEDGWLELDCGGNMPHDTVEMPKGTVITLSKKYAPLIRDDFNRTKLHLDYQSLNGQNK